MSSSKSSNSGNQPAIVWFRDDLRLADHPALTAAIETGQPVLAVYVFDEESENIRQLGSAQKWFLHQALSGLSESLGVLNSRLDIFMGKSADIMESLVSETDAMAVFWNRRSGEAEQQLDAALKSAFRDRDITAKSFQGNLLHEPYAVKTGSDGPYRVYSPFWRALSAMGEPREPLPKPDKMNNASKPDNTISVETLNLLPTDPNWAEGWVDIWKADEEGAAKRLETFLDEGINGYAKGRDFPAKQNVSRLSPYLRFGLLSPYQLWHATRHAEEAGNVGSKDAEKFLKEIAWREFSHHLLFHYPDLGTKNYLEKFDDFPWKWAKDSKETASALAAWQKGKTGYPIVDAGMRELWQTGYLHNRVRMIVGSFLVKHLLIHWREGEAWFWDTLVDGDPANNTASWQWIAGSGADAAPYFRVFNPIIQGKKFDPDGDYVRKFVPELADLPDKHLHTPWDAPEEVLKESGITLGQTYPRPIIEHSRGRERALEAFEKIKKADS